MKPRRGKATAIRIPVSQAEWDQLNGLNYPATYEKLTGILGPDRALIILAASHHDRPVVAITEN